MIVLCSYHGITGPIEGHQRVPCTYIISTEFYLQLHHIIQATRARSIFIKMSTFTEK